LVRVTKRRAFTKRYQFKLAKDTSFVRTSFYRKPWAAKFEQAKDLQMELIAFVDYSNCVAVVDSISTATTTNITTTDITTTNTTTTTTTIIEYVVGH